MTGDTRSANDHLTLRLHVAYVRAHLHSGPEAVAHVRHLLYNRPHVLCGRRYRAAVVVGVTEADAMGVCPDCARHLHALNVAYAAYGDLPRIQRQAVYRLAAFARSFPTSAGLLAPGHLTPEQVASWPWREALAHYLDAWFGGGEGHQVYEDRQLRRAMRRLRLYKMAARFGGSFRGLPSHYYRLTPYGARVGLIARTDPAITGVTARPPSPSILEYEFAAAFGPPDDLPFYEAAERLVQDDFRRAVNQAVRSASDAAGGKPPKR